jgi:transcriptional regulator with XRE-family HTH domain
MVRSVAAEPIYQHIAKQLRKARERAGFTQADAGRYLDPRMTRAAIQQMERGKSRQQLHVLDQLAELYGCELSDFLK